MDLQGQDGERGYAMAALLVSLAVMSVLMSVAMPVWRHEAQREKEAELAFRGEQYARAVALYRHKNANNFPPSIDVLVQGKYLRKKYKDPMIPDGEFRIIPVGGAAGAQGDGSGRGGTAGTGRGGSPPAGRGSTPPVAGSGLTTTQGGTFAGGGIMGVASKSTQTSIRIYRGQTRYDMWPFIFNVSNRPGGNMPMANAPGGRGQAQPGPGGAGRGTGPGRGVGPGRGLGPGAGRGVGPGEPGRGAGGPGRGFGPGGPGRGGGAGR